MTKYLVASIILRQLKNRGIYEGQDVLTQKEYDHIIRNEIMGNSEKLIIMLSRMEWKSRKAQGVQGEALQLKIYINKNNMNLIFRTAGAEDLSEIISLLADDELGQNKEDFRLPIPEAYIGETENLFK